MTNKLDPGTRNNDIGLFLARSERVTYLGGADYKLPDRATIVKSIHGGDLVYKDSITGSIGIWNFEVGEPMAIIFDTILQTATINGIVETTAVGDWIWGTAPAKLN